MDYKPDIERVVDRYRRLWRFEEVKPPVMMVSAPETRATEGAHDCGFWEDPDSFVEKYREGLSSRRFIPDDAIPMLRVPFSHSALPAVCGAGPELHEGKLWTRPILERLDDYKKLRVDDESVWLGKIKHYYRRLLELAEGKFAVGLCEIPGPADLMGALRGFERLLYDAVDRPETVKDFALHAAGLAEDFHARIVSLLSGQEGYGGVWTANAWSPADTVFFCEHTVVNYSPLHYAGLFKPANDLVFSRHGHALTYVYLKSGAQHIDRYFNRGSSVWVRSSDIAPSPEIIEKFHRRSILSLSLPPDQFREYRAMYGGTGICYDVECRSLEEARQFCQSVSR